jgi:hypothetical protein
MKRKDILMVYKYFGIELFHLTSEKIIKINKCKTSHGKNENKNEI